MCLFFFLSFYFCTHFDGEQGADHFNCFAGVFWLLVFHDSFSWFLGLVCSLWLKQFLIILPSSFYIYKSIKYSGRLVLREKLFKETQPWRTLDIIQKYDRPLLDLFQFTELSLSVAWNSRSFDSKCTTIFGGRKLLCVNQSVYCLVLTMLVIF